MALNRDVAITWLGHSTFLVESPGGKSILLDPWLEGNPACPPERQTIQRCDLVLLSHAHGDHIGSAIPVAQSTGARVVAQVELAEWLGTKGVKDAIGMNKGGTVWHEGISVTMVHALHSSSIEDNGRTLYDWASPSSGFLSSSSTRVHFGLGAEAKVAEIEVRWPGGAVTRVADVPIDRVLAVSEK